MDFQLNYIIFVRTFFQKIIYEPVFILYRRMLTIDQKFKILLNITQ